jgi:lipopolysaccharide/colanic/teichoic acid biosynthesis glycosyltransferase
VSERAQAGRVVGVAWEIPRDAVKRAIDIAIATTALVILSPIFLVVAIAVRVSSAGPVLFRQERLGRERQPFTMLKFRTMRDGSDDRIHREFVTDVLTTGRVVDTGLQKLTDDPRITRVGAILRRLSIDELPQLVNVLTGRMSLVGPRPALPWEADLFPAAFHVRFRVKPGITGLWQVSGRSELTMLQALELDATYVAERTTLLDLRILLRTVPVVISGRGAS